MRVGMSQSVPSKSKRTSETPTNELFARLKEVGREKQDLKKEIETLENQCGRVVGHLDDGDLDSLLIRIVEARRQLEARQWAIDCIQREMSMRGHTVTKKHRHVSM